CCNHLPLANNAFLISGGVLTTLPNFPGADATNATAINDAGDIVGTYLLDGSQHGFLYSGNVFSTIDYPGSGLNQVFGINNLGQLVGETADGSFLFSGGTYSAISVPNGVGTAARGINDAGQIVGSYGLTDAGPVRGFLLSDGVFTTIQYPGAT